MRILEVERREISVLSNRRKRSSKRICEIDGGRRVRIDDTFSQPCLRKNYRYRWINVRAVEESGLEVCGISAIEGADLRGRKLHRVDQTARWRIDKPDVSTHSKRVDSDDAVRGDIRSAINLAVIDVNVFRVTRIALDRTFTVLIPKLFDKVLLPEEVSDLSSEADIGRRPRERRPLLPRSRHSFPWALVSRSCHWESQSATVGTKNKPPLAGLNERFVVPLKAPATMALVLRSMA